jgi:cell division protein FtsN
MTQHENIPGRLTYRGSLASGGQRSGHRGRGLGRAQKGQKGGFAVGLVVGLLIGLVLALGVALYVTKVPLPFINKVPQRTAEQDAAEAERNKNWDPNSPLAIKPGARGTAPGTAGTPGSPTPLPAGTTGAPAPTAAAPAASAVRPAVTTAAVPASAPKPLRPGVDPLIYFAQAGAYTRADDAEAQRAKLALLGMDAKVTERDQSGRTIYRVRVGPFDARAQAEAMLERLQTAGVDSTLVRVARQ